MKPLLSLSCFLICTNCLFAQFDDINLSEYQSNNTNSKQESRVDKSADVDRFYDLFLGKNIVYLLSEPNYYLISTNDSKTILNLTAIKKGDVFTIVEIDILDSFKQLLSQTTSTVIVPADANSWILSKKQQKDFYNLNFANLPNDFVFKLKSKDNNTFYLFMLTSNEIKYENGPNNIGKFGTFSIFTFVEEIQEFQIRYEGKMVYNKGHLDKETGVFDCIKVGPLNGSIAAVLKDTATNEIFTVGLSLFRNRCKQSVNNYMNTRYFDSNDSIIVDNTLVLYHDMDSITKTVERRKAEQERQKNLQDVAYQKEMINKYGEKFGQAILQKKICIGMTKEMCIAAKGKPCDKTVTTTRYGEEEVWTYGCGGYIQLLNIYEEPTPTYIYFENGVIVRIIASDKEPDIIFL